MDVVQSLRVSGTVAPIGWIVRKSEGHVRRHAGIVPETGGQAVETLTALYGSARTARPDARMCPPIIASRLAALISTKAPHPRRGPAHRRQHRQAAGAFEEVKGGHHHNLGRSAA